MSDTKIPPEAQAQINALIREHVERLQLYGQVRPESSIGLSGHRTVFVGNKAFRMPSEKCKYLTSFLWEYVPLVFGHDWGYCEGAKPPGERHPVMQWALKGSEYAKAQSQLPNESRASGPSGPLHAYMTFAYDLYTVDNNNGLDGRLVHRLKQINQFQGARHELFAEATCLRAGFAVEHENERDGSTRHAEFTATHRITGQKFSVEAKSPHRAGVVGQPGVPRPRLDLDFGRLLNKAIAKNPPHPLVVFLDMNMPFGAASQYLSQQPGGMPHRRITDTLARIRKHQKGNDPISLLLITNHPAQHTRDDEIAPQDHLLIQIPTQLPVPREKIPQFEAMMALFNAAQLYGNIPHQELY
jgi:hypothetical protein